MKNARMSVVFGMLILMAFIGVYASGAPRIISYQGKLTNASGVALDGSQDITFKLYTTETGGTPIWTEAHTSSSGHPVTVTNGLFDVELGTITSLNIAFDDTYWIELQVGTETLSPRERMVAVPYAFRAIVADTAMVVGSGAVQTDGTTITGDGTASNPLSAVLGNSIESGEITNGTIVNADISSSAAIDWSKINHPTLDNYQYWTATDGANNTNVNSTGSLTFTGTGGASVTVSSGTVTIDASSAGDGNNYTTGISFSGTTTKTLTLSRSGMSDLTATFTDNVNDADADATNEAQTLSGSGTSDITLSSVGGTGGGTITFSGSGATSVSRSGNTITISSTDNNTTYSAGNGISLSGTVFSVAGNTGLTQNADGLSIDNTWFSGDATVSSSGVITISNDAVQASDIDWGNGSDQVDATDVPYYSGHDWNWIDPDPSNTGDALDSLASKIETIVAGGGEPNQTITTGTGCTGAESGTTGDVTIDVGAGDGIDVSATTVSVDVTDILGNGLNESSNNINVVYGSAANTAVQGNTSITITAGTGLSGGGSITLGAGGSVTLNNNDAGSSQNIFKRIQNSSGTTQFSAGSNNDYLQFAGSGGASVSFDATHHRITIDASGASDGNNYTTGISFSGTTTKTLTLSRSGMSDLTATFTDNNTTYSAGNGISLSGTEFSVAAGTGLTQTASGLSLTVPVTVSNGGTGRTSLTDNRILLGNGTSAIDYVAAPATGWLHWNGSAYEWTTPPDNDNQNLSFSGSSSPYSLNISGGSGVTFKAGSNVTLSRSGNELTIASTNPGGDITAVNAGDGLTGGGTSGSVTLNVGAGNGISVAADAVSVKVLTSGSTRSGLDFDASGNLKIANGAAKASSTSYKVYRNY